MKIKGGWSHEDRKRWIIFCDISRKQVWKELSCMPSLFIRTVIVVVAANNETGSYRGKAYTPLSAVSQKILVTQIINRMENLTRIPRPLSMARDRFALFAATRSAVKRCHVYVCVCVCAFDCSTWFCIVKTAILSIILPREQCIVPHHRDID